MEKRKTPKEVIESTSPEVEHTFIKAPRRQLIQISKDESETRAVIDLEKEYKLWSSRGEKKHLSLHTHPYSDKKSYAGFGGLPGIKDLDALYLRSDKIKAEIVAQRDREEGNAQGYTFVHLKKSAESGHERIERFRRAMNREIKDSQIYDSMPAKEYYEELLKLGKEAGFDIRFHPERDYYFDKNTGCYEKKEHSLENIAASILIGFALLGLLIKVPFTGFIISNSISSNYKIGLSLILGLIFSLVLYFVLRRGKFTNIKKSKG